MNSRTVLIVSTLLGAPLSACGSGSTAGPDATTDTANPRPDGALRSDAGSSRDTGTTRDTGTPRDGSVAMDTGTPRDTGTATDTGASMDTGGVTDSGTAMDTGSPQDSGGVRDTGTSNDVPVTPDVPSTGRTVPVGHCGAQRGLYFPENTWMYTDITSAPARPDSSTTTAWLEAHGGWGNSNHFQIDNNFVILDADSSTPRVSETSSDPDTYSTDCDPNVMVPLPSGGRVEGEPDYVCPGRDTGNAAGDCHLLVADFADHTLFEAYAASYTGGQFYTDCTVAWNTTRDVWGLPPAPGSTLPPVSTRNWGIGRDCTGPDAAGFPIAPLLFTVGDVVSGRVEHAIRFALPNGRMQRAATSAAESPIYVWPATHAGAPSAVDPAAPIYGSRWRLRADFDPASRGLDPNNLVVKAVVYGLQHYGMALADGGNIALMAEDSSGCSGGDWSTLWGSRGARVLDGIRPSDFEVLDTGGTEAGWDCARNAR